MLSNSVLHDCTTNFCTAKNLLPDLRLMVVLASLLGASWNKSVPLNCGKLFNFVEWICFSLFEDVLIMLRADGRVIWVLVWVAQETKYAAANNRYWWCALITWCFQCQQGLYLFLSQQVGNSTIRSLLSCTKIKYVTVFRVHISNYHIYMFSSRCSWKFPHLLLFGQTDVDCVGLDVILKQTTECHSIYSFLGNPPTNTDDSSHWAGVRDNILSSKTVTHITCNKTLLVMHSVIIDKKLRSLHEISFYITVF